ncbi:MAG: type II toxin-antitoxin system RelE/ParE family toxin [Deltaproteobacteria bacterium]|nr:type II toxin-antitoxin system RelE/ParE family toxin [Deltaproteobacteria bacterium]MBI2341956.1 type II toxin-antitoxin system RelE/ParE family toxin [Deltaproteobacteria bacterium]
MSYHLVIPPLIAKSLTHLHPVLKGKIRDALKSIEENPYLGKPLQGKLSGLMSFRATYYRIIYRIVLQEKRIEAIDIGPRKTIYEKIFNWKLP